MQKNGIGWDRWIELIFAGAITFATFGNVMMANWQWSAINESNR
jgi:hypothetical protein